MNCKHSLLVHSSFFHSLFICFWIAIISLCFVTHQALAHDHKDSQSQHHKHNNDQSLAINIDHARINPTVAGMRVTGVYFNITNNSAEAIVLTKVTSTISDRIEIHEHVMKDGLMKMQQVSGGIKIPAKQSLSLKPGGYHIMVMNLDAAITPNTIASFTLHFSNKEKIDIHAKALETKIMPQEHHH